MAIQMRRGPWSQFDPTKMLPGEWAVILSGHPDTSNGQALYHCFAAGVVKQIATIEDAAAIIANATEDIREELTQDIASALAQVGAATNAANTATANANTATSAANAATQAATSASERAEDAIDAMGDISELAVPLMSKDIRGGAKLEENGGLVLRNEKLGIGSLVQESDGAVRGGLAEVTAKGHAEQASTTGKNLLPNTATSQTINGVTFTVNADGSITANGTATDLAQLSVGTRSFDAKVYYCISGCPNGGSTSTYCIHQYGGNFDDIGSGCVFWYNYTTSQGAVIRIASGYTCNNLTFYPMIEEGSTKTEYEPYTGGAPSPSPEFPQTIEVVSGHTVTGKTGRFVDLEVRDANDQLLSTTPIPLPQRGWVGSLPDGTADSLRLDGAGKVEWTEKTNEVMLDGSSDENWTAVSTSNGKYRISSGPALKSPMSRGFADNVKASALCTAYDIVTTSQTYAGGGIGFAISPSSAVYVFDEDFQTAESFISHLSTHPVTVLYPLATPVTEDLGYVDMPAIPSDATVTISELDSVGIKYFIDSSVTELAKQWYTRAYTELGDAIVDLAQRVSQLEG